MATIGFIGLGAMGTPMALNLLSAGHTLHVHARRAEASTALLDAGAHACASPAAVASLSEVVVTMVTDTEAVEAVLLGPDGVAAGAHAGLVVIDHSTIDPIRTKTMATTLMQHGVSMLDAPVSGGVDGARSRSLVMMVGGDRHVCDRLTPLLAVNAARVVYMGPAGSGQTAKACNQICIVVTQLGVAEALLLAERAGLDTSRLLEVLSGGFAASRILEVQGPKMVARDFTGRIESRLHYKDILMAIQLGQTLGLRMSASGLAAEALGALQRTGGATLDSAAVLTVVESGEV